MLNKRIKTIDLKEYKQIGYCESRSFSHYIADACIERSRNACIERSRNMVSTSDYYPFGMQIRSEAEYSRTPLKINLMGEQMPDRDFSSDAYRYGFQGQSLSRKQSGGKKEYEIKSTEKSVGENPNDRAVKLEIETRKEDDKKYLNTTIVNDL